MARSPVYDVKNGQYAFFKNIFFFTLLLFIIIAMIEIENARYIRYNVFPSGRFLYSIKFYTELQRYTVCINFSYKIC